MKSFKILIALLIIIFTSNALNGCAAEKEAVSDSKMGSVFMSNLGMARIEAASEFKKTAELKLKVISKEGDLYHLQLILENPGSKPIQSVEAWLSYNPKLLKALSFTPNEKGLQLMAPYENGFDEKIGLIKFGRSTAQATKENSLVLADFSFQALTTSPISIEVYDYQYGLTGHNSANIMQAGEPLNILLKPTTPLILIKN